MKEREHRLDGLFHPPAQAPELPVVLLKAQMAADPRFLRRLYAQSARVVEQESAIEHWLELESTASDPAAPPCCEPCRCWCSRRRRFPPAALSSRPRWRARRTTGRSLPELCAMGGITLEDFTRSVANQEILGQGRQEGELDLVLRLLHRRRSPLSSEQLERVRALPMERIEALGEALLEFRDASDLEAWLRAEG